jgi:hypothetical protein
MTRLDPEDTEIYQPEMSLCEYWRWSRVHDPLWLASCFGARLPRSPRSRPGSAAVLWHI